MNKNTEDPEQLREHLRQKEIKNNPTGVFKDGIDRAQHGNLADLAGSLGWKGIGILIAVIIIGYLIAPLFTK